MKIRDKARRREGIPLGRKTPLGKTGGHVAVGTIPTCPPAEEEIPAGPPVDDGKPIGVWASPPSAEALIARIRRR